MSFPSQYPNHLCPLLICYLYGSLVSHLRTETTHSLPEESFNADSDSSTDTLANATEKGGEGLWAGSQLGVVSGFQALSGARVTWVSGVDLFTDKFANEEISKYVYASPSFRCMILILLKGREIWKHNSCVMSQLGLSKSLWYGASKMVTIIS